MKLKMLILPAVFLVLSLACAIPAPDVTPEVPAAIVAPRVVSPAPLVRHLYKVTADVLEIRSGAGEVNLNIGYLHAGDIVTVYGTQKTTLEKCSEWADIDGGRWVCLDRLERAGAVERTK